ncbi:MAG: 16S rRNA (guanine(527)-N(7))-methyltransferase RsmG [Clostridia bacterium]
MDIREELVLKAKEIGVKIKPAQAEKFQRYYELLIEWNEKINLTAITEASEIVTKHFVDSLAILKYVDIKQDAKMIDVGTGAGFPAVPIKIMRPDIDMTLLDGLNKRLKFLAVVGEELGLEFTCVHKRAEEAGRMNEMRESYDVAVARAVAKMNTLCEYCIPLIKMKGKFVAMKGPALSEELVEAKRAMGLLGCSLKSEETFVLPDNEKSERKIAVLQKFSFTPKIYPRHGNKISKDPL